VGRLGGRQRGRVIVWEVQVGPSTFRLRSRQASHLGHKLRTGVLRVRKRTSCFARILI